MDGTCQCQPRLEGRTASERSVSQSSGKSSLCVYCTRNTYVFRVSPASLLQSLRVQEFFHDLKSPKVGGGGQADRSALFMYRALGTALLPATWSLELGRRASAQLYMTRNL
jgi:hypothetical protein